MWNTASLNVCIYKTVSVSYSKKMSSHILSVWLTQNSHSDLEKDETTLNIFLFTMTILCYNEKHNNNF